eukprot:NODE_1391_length_1355_cov_0.859935_g1379_i0.p1 GENE.NODE_1391_length_1355_cov_0.859935_g1379_i0~~NODE_1391_length_1355_cov_0.859935_g1379_i0.p1  ORF type:complete len:376 (-),score=41.27 NODE_1391_length_1355_cov_0.859935_g1379_i0:151-1278(-)
MSKPEEWRVKGNPRNGGNRGKAPASSGGGQPSDKPAPQRNQAGKAQPKQQPQPPKKSEPGKGRASAGSNVPRHVQRRTLYSPISSPGDEARSTLSKWFGGFTFEQWTWEEKPKKELSPFQTARRKAVTDFEATRTASAQRAETEAWRCTEDTWSQLLEILPDDAKKRVVETQKAIVVDLFNDICEDGEEKTGQVVLTVHRLPKKQHPFSERHLRDALARAATVAQANNNAPVLILGNPPFAGTAAGSADVFRAATTLAAALASTTIADEVPIATAHLSPVDPRTTTDVAYWARSDARASRWADAVAERTHLRRRLTFRTGARADVTPPADGHRRSGDHAPLHPQPAPVTHHLRRRPPGVGGHGELGVMDPARRAP